MKRFFAAAVVLCLVATAAQSFWQSRVQVSVGAVAGYQGLGDVTPGATVYYGTRGYNAAYSAKAIQVCLPADTACNDATISSGNLVLNAAQSTCNNSTVICTAKVIYDQIGTACSGACDITQTTEASRYKVVFNAVGTWTCLSATSSQLYASSASALGSSLSQPFTYVATAMRNNGTTASQGVIGDSTSGGSIGFGTAVNTASIYAGGGGAPNITGIADNSFHALQSVVQGATTTFYADGTLTSPTSSNPGTSSFAGAVRLGTDVFGNKLQGFFCEATLYSGDQSAGFSARNSNIHTYGGF